MKKQTLVLLAGGLLTFAACTNDQATGGYTQEQLDSAVNARITEIQAQLQASNDSAINALAQIKADSMIAAMQGGSNTGRSTTRTPPKTTTPSTTTPVTPATPSNPKDARFNGGKVDDKDKKASRFDNDAADRNKDAETKKKEDRFK